MHNLSCFDVAAFILDKKKKDSITAMKMQKLLYYSQVWHLVWNEKPLFCEEFEAWVNGPVCRNYFEEHKGNLKIEHEPRGDATKLTPKEQSTVNAVLEAYGNKDASWLSEKTHQEKPWLEARNGIITNSNRNKIINQNTMIEFYSDF